MDLVLRHAFTSNDTTLVDGNGVENLVRLICYCH